MTPKPIVVLYYLPETMISGNGEIPTPYKVNEGLGMYLPDYHVFAIPSNKSADGSCEYIRLQVFYEKDFTPIQYEELKQMVLESIEKGTGKINKQ